MSAVNIDRLAREAKKEADNKGIDYVKHARELPIKPFNWQIIIEPQRPKETSKGGIIITDTAKEVAQVQTTVGRIIAVGPTAFCGKTQSGVELSKFSPDIKTPQDLIGRYVLYQRYTGLEVKFKRGQRMIVMDDTNILCDVPNPDELLFYYD